MNFTMPARRRALRNRQDRMAAVGSGGRPALRRGRSQRRAEGRHGSGNRNTARIENGNCMALRAA